MSFDISNIGGGKEISWKVEDTCEPWLKEAFYSAERLQARSER